MRRNGDYYEKKENVSGRIRAKAGVQNGIVSDDEFRE